MTANDSVFDPLLAEIQEEEQQKMCPRCGCCGVRWEGCSHCIGLGLGLIFQGYNTPKVIDCPRCEGTRGRFVCAGGCGAGGRHKEVRGE